MVVKIVSGGQTGADRGGLDAAIYCGLPYGGWVPQGRRAEDGVVPEVYGGLRESGSRAYVVRTEANVADSDATVVFCYGPPEGGSRRTLDFAVKHRRPHLAVDLGAGRAAATARLAAWLGSVTLPAGVLNVAGSRESKSPGIQLEIQAVIIDALSRVNGKMFYPLPCM